MVCQQQIRWFWVPEINWRRNIPLYRDDLQRWWDQDHSMIWHTYRLNFYILINQNRVKIKKKMRFLLHSLSYVWNYIHFSFSGPGSDVCCESNYYNLSEWSLGSKVSNFQPTCRITTNKRNSMKTHSISPAKIPQILSSTKKYSQSVTFLATLVMASYWSTMKDIFIWLTSMLLLRNLCSCSIWLHPKRDTPLMSTSWSLYPTTTEKLWCRSRHWSRKKAGSSR